MSFSHLSIITQRPDPFQFGERLQQECGCRVRISQSQAQIIDKPLLNTESSANKLLEAHVRGLQTILVCDFPHESQIVFISNLQFPPPASPVQKLKILGSFSLPANTMLGSSATGRQKAPIPKAGSKSIRSPDFRTHRTMNSATSG